MAKDPVLDERSPGSGRYHAHRYPFQIPERLERGAGNQLPDASFPALQPVIHGWFLSGDMCTPCRNRQSHRALDAAVNGVDGRSTDSRMRLGIQYAPINQAP